MSQPKRPPARPHSPAYLWMSEHYDELFADGEPVNGEWLREQAIKHKLTDLAGRLPSDSNLRQTLHRVRKAHEKRKVKVQERTKREAAPEPVAAPFAVTAAPEPPPRRPFAVVNPVVLGAPVTTEKHQFRFAKMKGSES